MHNDLVKHNITVTTLLVALFVITQLVGLGLIAHSMEVSVDKTGTIAVSYPDTAIGERPDTQGASSFLLLVIGVGVGTLLLLLLIKFRQVMVWKAWYFLAVTMTLAVALGAVVTVWIAGMLAFVLAAWKIFRPNVIIHNLTEVFVYAGIALLISPLLNVFWMSALLIAFALYDLYAVFKSKHMVAMAQFQTDSKLFAGVMIPYGKPRKAAPKQATQTTTNTQARSAILGGGDLALPLIFSGVVLHWLVEQGVGVGAAFGYTLLVVFGATAALAGLFVYAKKGKFYPAMPPIALGCFVGLALVWLVAL